MATYSSSVKIEFNLGDHSTKADVLQAIDNIAYTSGGTRTSLALRTVRTEMLVESAGMRPVSEGIPRVAIVVTDGAANPGYEPAAEALKLHANDVNVFAIGARREPLNSTPNGGQYDVARPTPRTPRGAYV